MNAISDLHIAAGLTDAAIFGPSICEFLAARGGLKDRGGDLRAMDAHLWHRAVPFRRKLVNDAGMSLDAAALAAWEAGYFGDGLSGRPEIRDLLDLIASDLQGVPVYAPLDFEGERRLAAREFAIETLRNEPAPVAAPVARQVSHHVPDGSVARWNGDAVAYVYQQEFTTKAGRVGMSYYAKIYANWQDRKAASHHVYRTEAERDSAVTEFFNGRR